jgi:hypothetical protein
MSISRDHLPELFPCHAWVFPTHIPWLLRQTQGHLSAQWKFRAGEKLVVPMSAVVDFDYLSRSYMHTYTCIAVTGYSQDSVIFFPLLPSPAFLTWLICTVLAHDVQYIVQISVAPRYGNCSNRQAYPLVTDRRLLCLRRGGSRHIHTSLVATIV